jgi:hypothetical protein
VTPGTLWEVPTGLCPTSRFLKLENTTFQKLDLFPLSGDGRKVLALFGPLERMNLVHWKLLSMLRFSTFHWLNYDSDVKRMNVFVFGII